MNIFMKYILDTYYWNLVISIAKVISVYIKMTMYFHYPKIGSLMIGLICTIHSINEIMFTLVTTKGIITFGRDITQIQYHGQIDDTAFQTAKTLETTSSGRKRHRADAKVLERYLIYGDPRCFFLCGIFGLYILCNVLINHVFTILGS